MRKPRTPRQKIDSRKIILAVIIVYLAGVLGVPLSLLTNELDDTGGILHSLGSSKGSVNGTR